jgi:hypothetical protein
MHITRHLDPLSADEVFTVQINTIELSHIGRHIEAEIIHRVGEQIAAEFLDKHGSEVMGRISADAVAQMAIAEAGAAVNHTLKQKLPDKILETVRTEKEVYQRGIFGGLSRIR